MLLSYLLSAHLLKTVTCHLEGDFPFPSPFRAPCHHLTNSALLTSAVPCVLSGANPKTGGN